jgi:hypothetical protein
MHEDEFIFGAAVLECGLQPIVLRFAERPVPRGIARWRGIGAVGIGRGVPEQPQSPPFCFLAFGFLTVDFFFLASFLAGALFFLGDFFPPVCSPLE